MCAACALIASVLSTARTSADPTEEAALLTQGYSALYQLTLPHTPSPCSPTLDAYVAIVTTGTSKDATTARARLLCFEAPTINNGAVEGSYLHRILSNALTLDSSRYCED